jgi:hypothetical protein
VIREGIAIYASLAGTSDVSGTLVAPRTDDGSHLKKKHSKNKRKRTKKPSKWADKCMYAELLEMKEEPNLWGDHSNDAGDGLPSDLERSWVAVAPVPTGKRCLAITHQSTSGIIGICANIRSQFKMMPLTGSFYSTKYHSSVSSPGENATSSLSVLAPTANSIGLHSRRQLENKRDFTRPRCPQVERSGHRRL